MYSNWSSRADAQWIAAATFVLFAALGCNDDDEPGGTQGQSPVGMMPVAGTNAAAGTTAPAAGRGGAGSGAGAAGARAGTSGGIAGQAAGAAAPDDDAGSEPTETPDAGTPPADSGTTTEPPARPDLEKGDGSDVITIGDSWMSLGTTGIQQSLVKASGQPYRTYGRGGTRLLNEVIPGQYATAKRADSDIKTVVMTGGGNDIIQVPGLRADCMAMGAQCAMVVGEILDRLTQLWTEMAADGVQDVIYVQYSNPEGDNVDYAQASGDGLAKRCAEVPAPLRCHRVETLDIVMGEIPDGIHPSSAAYDRLGVAVHDLMINEGMRR